MDPVRVPETFDPLPRGPSLFIPFNCINIKPNGTHDKEIAIDLPPMKTMHLARLYLLNNRALVGRAIDYIEYSNAEIIKNESLMSYLGIWKGRY